jgi:hypothetical protein
MCFTIENVQQKIIYMHCKLALWPPEKCLVTVVRQFYTVKNWEMWEGSGAKSYMTNGFLILYDK